MSDIITALKADPFDPDKVLLFIDGKQILTVALEVAAAEKLSIGQECPPSRQAPGSMILRRQLVRSAVLR